MLAQATTQTTDIQNYLPHALAILGIVALLYADNCLLPCSSHIVIKHSSNDLNKSCTKYRFFFYYMRFIHRGSFFFPLINHVT